MSFSFSKKYNVTQKLFDIDVSNFPKGRDNKPKYWSLEDLYTHFNSDSVFRFYGVYINTRSEIVDEQPLLALSDSYVNLPTHMTELCKEIRNDENAVEAINNGLCGFTVYQYQSKKRNDRLFYSVRWVDIIDNGMKVIDYALESASQEANLFKNGLTVENVVGSQ